MVSHALLEIQQALLAGTELNLDGKINPALGIALTDTYANKRIFNLDEAGVDAAKREGQGLCCRSGVVGA